MLSHVIQSLSFQRIYPVIGFVTVMYVIFGLELIFGRSMLMMRTLNFAFKLNVFATSVCRLIRLRLLRFLGHLNSCQNPRHQRLPSKIC